MTALQLILINVIVLGGAAWLVYALTHGNKNKSNPKVQH